MNRLLALTFVSLLFGASVAAAYEPDNDAATTASVHAAGISTTPPAAVPTGSDPDAQFYQEALAGGEQEVELSRLAMRESGSAVVKNLASTMVNDHTALDQELMAAGKLPEPAPTPASKDAAASFQKMSGALLDRTYLATMANDHQRAIALYEDASHNAQRETTRDLAMEALPKLRQHLLAIQEAQKNAPAQ